MAAAASPEGDREDGGERESEARALLAHLGTAMIATGQPVQEVEEELVEVSRRLGYAGVQVAASPTGLLLAMTDGGPATLRQATARWRLGQSADVRRIRHELLVGELAPGVARTRLAALAQQPRRYPAWAARVAWVPLASGIALILQPGWPNVAAAAVAAVLVLGLVELAERVRLVETLLPTLAAFAVAVLVFAAAGSGLLEGPLRTVLPPLAVLLPGALLVTGMSELAAGHMQAGSARLIYGVVQLGLFALGLVAATTLLGLSTAALVNVRVDGIGWWATPAGLLLIGPSICVMEDVPLRVQGWILVVLTIAASAQVAGQQLGSPGLAGFLGAVAASLAATAIELVRPHVARLVLFLPAFWLLVPGSLGLLGVSQLATDPGRAVAAVLEVVVVIGAIALGLLVGSSIGQTLRTRLRPAPWPDPSDIAGG